RSKPSKAGKADPTNAIRTGSMTEGNHVQRVASAPKTPNQNRLFQQNRREADIDCCGATSAMSQTTQDEVKAHCGYCRPLNQ
ncbi:MAG: hypothetical protein AAGF74_19005, partial [Pseudomonadota bacterium]